MVGRLPMASTAMAPRTVAGSSPAAWNGKGEKSRQCLKVLETKRHHAHILQQLSLLLLTGTSLMRTRARLTPQPGCTNCMTTPCCHCGALQASRYCASLPTYGCEDEVHIQRTRQLLSRQVGRKECCGHYSAYPRADLQAKWINAERKRDNTVLFSATLGNEV